MIRVLVFTALLNSCWGATVVYATTPVDPCETAITQVEITACSVIAYKAADQALNETYKVIMPSLTNPQREKLRDAQRAWIRFRDANCEQQAFDTRGGTIYQAVKNDCLTRITWQRHYELQHIYPGLFPNAPSPQATADNATQLSHALAKHMQPIIGGQSNTKISSKALVGHWASMSQEDDLHMHFNIVSGQTLYSSVLKGSPFEAGIWQLLDDQLLITTSTGEQLRLYNKVTLQDDILTLYVQDGSMEQYERVE